MPRFTSDEIGEELLELNDNASEVNQIQGQIFTRILDFQPFRPTPSN